MITKSRDDLIKLLHGDEPSAMHELVAIDRLTQFSDFWRKMLAAVGELPPLGTACGSQRSLATLDERRGLLRGREFHYDMPLCQNRRKAAGAEPGTKEN